ncbi:MAG: hypothetical protein RRB13_02735 [bacterium]|nr:hypothetical protein [bacterium]
MLSELFHHLTPADWSNLIDALALVTAVIFPGAGAYLVALKRGKDELIQAIDAAPVQNQDVLKSASFAGLKRAAAEIAKLEQRKAMAASRD